MNRRSFATFVGQFGFAALIAELVPERWIRAALSLPPLQPKTYGAWDIADDGTMSLGGQTDFAVYGPTGGLGFATVSYKWVAGEILEITRTPKWDASTYSTRVVVFPNS